MTHDHPHPVNFQPCPVSDLSLTHIVSAGISMGEISGTATSVHTGCFTADYLLASMRDPEYGPKYSAAGTAGSMLSNRISTFFNLTGPSLTIDTACSSSLVALDMACRSIRQGEASTVRTRSQFLIAETKK